MLKFIILYDFARLQMPGGMQQQNMQQRGVMGMGGMQGPRPQNPQNVMNQQGMNPMNQMNNPMNPNNQMQQQQNRMPMQPGQQQVGPRQQGGPMGQNPNQQRKLRYFVALFDYDPLTMSPNPDSCEEELPFREGDTIKVRLQSCYVIEHFFCKFKV